MRVAAVDIGTNTVLLLVAEARVGATPVAIEERATITRLGEGVDRTRALAPEAVARTARCLDDYAKVIADCGVERVDVVGTSAMRDASGGEALRAHVRARLGVEARVIGGDEEARLTFIGALAGLPAHGDRAHATVFDIGGGSTEIVQGTRSSAAGDASIAFARSYDVGSVRMTERHLRGDPPSREELDSVRADAQRIASDLPALAPGEEPVGIAGTITTLVAVAMGLDPYDGARVHGARLEIGALESVVERLASMTLEERRTVPGLDPKRADVIVAGGLVALSLLQRWSARALVASDRGVRWGLALALCK
jgi:exopolyphosphatase/guanosine-5'-triphosphate,3'-diphosphate pyrophosphatase